MALNSCFVMYVSAYSIWNLSNQLTNNFNNRTKTTILGHWTIVTPDFCERTPRCGGWSRGVWNRRPWGLRRRQCRRTVLLRPGPYRKACQALREAWRGRARLGKPATQNVSPLYTEQSNISPTNLRIWDSSLLMDHLEAPFRSMLEQNEWTTETRVR